MGMNMKETKEQQRERTDSKIMRATLEIIIAQGIGAVNIESVARVWPRPRSTAGTPIPTT